MGKLIVIEGIDGSGKTSIAQSLCMRLGESAKFLSKKSTDTATPYQHLFMSEVRPILWNRSPKDPIHEIDEESWLYLHVLWYHMLQEFVIIPKLRQYEYVVMDGWYYKFLARHLVNKKMNEKIAMQLVSRLLQGDKIFLLNISPDICFLRKGIVKPSECGVHKDACIRDSQQAFRDYQTKVHEAYQSLDTENLFVNIDGSCSVECVVSDIIKKLERI